LKIDNNPFATGFRDSKHGYVLNTLIHRKIRRFLINGMYWEPDKNSLNLVVTGTLELKKQTTIYHCVLRQG
jgi:hypothetical protein